MSLLRKIVHLLFPVKRRQYRFIRKNAKLIRGKTILEIGAGEGYNVEKLFNKSNKYFKTDLIEFDNVTKLDITEEKLKPIYDVIVCIIVLEHIYDYQSALENISSGLKKGGMLFLSIPMFYPLHIVTR
ncbi:MAG: methyltransferase domain-containing protein [Candidatus Heimdallarchaeota archaeon]